MAARPVIYAVEASNDPVKDCGCGISVPAENPKAVVEAVIKIKNLSDEEKVQMGKRGKEYVLENHMYHPLAERFLTVIVVVSAANAVTLIAIIITIIKAKAMTFLILFISFLLLYLFFICFIFI